MVSSLRQGKRTGRCCALRWSPPAFSSFWNGSAMNPAELAKNSPDPGRIHLFIRPADRKFILDHHRAYGGPNPPPINHQGIEFGGDSASVVLYRYQGRWLKLQGAD